MPEPRGRTSRFSEPLPGCRLVPRTKNSLAARHHMSDRLAPNPLDRAELISLLETLGSDNDEEVLAAARVLDTKVTAAGASWNVLMSTRIGETEDSLEEQTSELQSLTRLS